MRGRDDELARLGELLTELREGRGGALVVRGEPGIGKTALLDELVHRCGDEVTVLRASGVQTEADLAFAVLSDLLAPVLVGSAELPAPQADALYGALALGPPSPGDRLAVCVATLGLLRITADTRPVLVVVDDVQWVDAASRECIRFAARRVSGAMAVVLAERDPETDHGSADGLPVTRIGPLAPDAARAVVGAVAPDMAARVVDAVVDAAAGNPLALVELPVTLTVGQRSGREPLDLPLPVGGRVREVIARRTAALGSAARRLLLLVAADGDCDLGVLATAAEACSADIAALDEAEVRGLVRVRGRRVVFTHPLMRSVIWRAAASGERREAHRALAAASSGEVRAWHLAAATIGADEQVAAELEHAAGVVAARRGYAAAANALERAAELSADREARARRTCAAGEAAAAAGQTVRALDLLGRAADTTLEVVLGALVTRRRGLVMGWSAEVASAAALLLHEADRIQGWDRRRAAPVLADAARGYLLLGCLDRGTELAEHAVALLTGEEAPLERADVHAALGWGLVLLGDLARAAAVWQEVERLAGPLDPRAPASAPLLVALHLCWRLPVGDFERALRESTQLVECNRTTGALGTLAQPLHVMSEAAYRIGDWATADTANTEALQIAEEVDQHLVRILALACRARLAAARGIEVESRQVGEAAFALADAQGLDSGRHMAGAALGFLELSLERVPDAIGHLERANRTAERCGLAEHGHVPWAADLIEAYVRVGCTASARRALDVLGNQVLGFDVAYPRAMHARCVGMLADDYDTAFTDALAWDDRRPMPFERARTQLAYGRRLHRERRRADARVQLRAALDGFERLGAAPWAAQARNELRAAGGRRPRTACDSTALSVQESRVAAVAARGGSTRDVATELFLAPKTVEFHLGQIYRKLGVRNRAQMIVALTDASPPPAE